jgi:hypothetical protein
MQFKVPQFLDIEDKIFGPFTFREFVYLAGGAGLCFVLYKLLGFWWSSVPILLVGGFALTLTFYRPNNKPFIFMVESFFHYIMQSKLYIWQRRLNTGKDKKSEVSLPMNRESLGSKLNQSKLRDLAWSLDVLDLKQKRNETEERN